MHKQCNYCSFELKNKRKCETQNVDAVNVLSKQSLWAFIFEKTKSQGEKFRSRLTDWVYGKRLRMKNQDEDEKRER